MNQAMMLFFQTDRGLPPQVVYAALIAGLVGIGVGVGLAWLVSKFYPSKAERAAKSSRVLRQTAHGAARTWRADDGGAPEATRDDHAASPPPAHLDLALEELRQTSRNVGSLLGANVKALTEKVNGLDPLLRGGQGGDQEFQAAVIRGFDGLRDELLKVNRAVLDLPDLVTGAVARSFGEERRRREDEQRRAQEEQRRARAEAERRARDEEERQRRELHEGFIRRLEDLRRSDLMQASLLTVQIADGLKQGAPERQEFEDLLPPYARFISAVDEARSVLKDPNCFAGEDLGDASRRVEAKFEGIEAAREDLERKHQPAWLLDLLERARGYQQLEERAQRLKELLHLEDIPVSVGTELEAAHMDDFQVIEAKGYGTRKIVSEVLGNGYRVKETGAVIRKPQVVLSLEG